MQMIQPVESDGRPSYRRYLAALFLCAFVVAGAFLLISDVNQQPKAKLDALIEGTAERPYVSRRLIPLLLSVATQPQSEDADAIPDAVQNGPALRSLLDWLALPDDYSGVLLLFLLLNYLFLVAFGLAFRRLAQRLDIPHPARLSLVALLLLLLPVFLSHGYVYDYSTLLLWTLLLLMLAEGRWRWTIAIVVLAAINKETALLIPLIWLTYGRTLGRPRLYWSMLLVQSAIVAVSWGVITWWFRNNGGGLYELNLPVHISAYQADPWTIAWVLLAVVSMLMVALPVAPPLLRSSALLLLPLAALYLFFGWPYEFRVFYEVYPTLVMLGALAIQRISRRLAAAPIALQRLHESQTGHTEKSMERGRQALRIFLLGVVLLAWFFRVWRLDEVPPGLLVQEALHGLDAAAVSATWPAPPMLTALSGSGLLFTYVQAGLISLIDVSAYSLRMAAAMIGTLTIAASFTLTRRLLVDTPLSEAAPLSELVAPETNDRDQQSLIPQYFATFSAATIALSYWPVSLSRLGLDAVMLPFTSALAGYFFWRAWNGARFRVWLLAGLWTGLTFYAGSTAYMFPAVLAAFVLLGSLFHPWRLHATVFGQRFRGLVMMTLVALLIAAPLAIQFIRSPMLLEGNTAELSVFTAAYALMPGTPRERLGQNLTGLLNAFYMSGDEDLRHNLPGMPLQHALLSIIFTVGFGVALWGIAKPAFRLIIVWLIIMALPTWLTVNAPANMQLSGIMPPLAALVGIGAAMLTRMRLPLLTNERMVSIVSAAILAIVGTLMAYNYFVRWPRMPGIAEAFGNSQYLAAEHIRMQLQTGSERSFLLSESLYQTPAMRLLVPDIEDQTDLAQKPARHPPGLPLDGQFLLDAQSSATDDLFLLGQASGRAYVVRHAAIDAAGNSLTDLLRRQGQPSATTADQPSLHRVIMGELPAHLDLVPFTIPNPLSITFESGLVLAGYEPVPAQDICPSPGESISLNTYWRRLPSYSASRYGNAMFAHLMAPQNQIQVNGTLRSDYPTAFWRPGEIVRDRRTFPIDSIQTSGKSSFEIGLYRRDLTGAYGRHALVDGAGNLAGDQVNLAPFFMCTDPPTVATSGLIAMDTLFEDRIELVAMGSQAADNDDTVLTVRLVWRGVDWMHTDYVAFVHLIDQAEQIVSQVDQPPGGTDNQTTQWAPGEMTMSDFALSLPPGIDVRRYQLRIGLYEPVSGRQLFIVAPLERRGNTYVVTPALQGK